MDIQNVIQRQLDQYYINIAQERDNSFKVRNWSITGWLACLALEGSGKLNLDFGPFIVLVSLLIIMFWANEGFHQSRVLIFEKRARKIEEILSSEELPAKLPLDNFLESGSDAITVKEKLAAFYVGCIQAETVLFFHLAMLIGSVIFYLLFYHYAFKPAINAREWI